jgi:hypothetical protein
LRRPSIQIARNSAETILPQISLNAAPAISHVVWFHPG